jgi:glycosyltransferase involved in cell wall biosynthesis
MLAEKKGRSHQMNLGAKMCTGDVYLFLHADSVLPDGWSSQLMSTINTTDVIGGCYCVRLSNRRFIYRLIGWMINARTLLFKSFSGDQAIFVSRGVFSTFGACEDNFSYVVPENPIQDGESPGGPGSVLSGRKISPFLVNAQ